MSDARESGANGGAAPTRAEPSLRVLLEAELIADIEASSRIAGTRGGWMSRQLLYRSGQLYMDLQLQPQLRTSTLSLTGQLLEKDAESGALTDLPIQLELADGRVFRTSSDEHGQFLLDCPLKDQVTLAVCVGPDVRMEVPLPAEHRMEVDS